MGGCFCSATGGEQVIDNDYALPWLYRILMDFHTGGPVFEIVSDFDGFAGEFPFFALRDKWLVEMLCNRNTK